MLNIKDLNAIGDGINDDSTAIQKALDSNIDVIFIPEGSYKINTTLKVNSNTKIIADKDAHIFCGNNTCLSKDSFLITNKDKINGNTNITIEGGLWDGNNLNNPRVDDILNVTTFTGALINFYNVTDLRLSNMVLKDSEAYYTRFCMIDNFLIEDIEFRADTLRPNQDGIHLGGFCSNGIIRRIYSHKQGVPNDDMIALNADDEVNRLTNADLKRGYIKNIDISEIHAIDCHSLVRILSVDAEISNITIKNTSSGCRNYAINMDAARYCRTPLFNDEDCPNGVGNVSNITIENMKAWKTRNDNIPLLDFETNSKNFIIKNFTRVIKKENENQAPTIVLYNVAKHAITIDNETIEIPNKDVYQNTDNHFAIIKLDKLN